MHLGPTGSIQARDCLTQEDWAWVWEKGKLTKATRLGKPTGEESAAMENRLWAGPALCDPQINGGLGINFGNPGPDPEPLAHFMGHLRRLGHAWILPTLITDALPHLETALHRLESLGSQIPGWAEFAPGYHIEGPWISPEDGYRGAHPRESVRMPHTDDFLRLFDASGGKIKLITLAPELPGALNLVEKVRSLGVAVAIGHTQATTETIAEAVRAGASLSTHLGNGLASLIPRHHNPIWPQLAHDGLTASFIPDGHHLPWPLVDCLLRCKGPERAIITADSSPVAGLPPGRYRLWNTEVDVSATGRVGLPGSPLLAGSGCFTDTCVRSLAQTGLVPVSTALSMASTTTARIFDLGSPWDPSNGTFVLFHNRPGNAWEPKLVCFHGEILIPQEEPKLH